MSYQVTAVYEDGVLRPLEPLTLPEHSMVAIRIDNIMAVSNLSVHRLRVREVLQRAQIAVSPIQKVEQRRRLTRKRREELAQTFSKGKPLSEIIIEERIDDD